MQPDDKPDRVGGRRLPPAGRPPAPAHRCPEHRPDEPGGVLPQLPVEMVPGRGSDARRFLTDPQAARPSTACHDEWKYVKEATPEQMKKLRKPPRTTNTDHPRIHRPTRLHRRRRDHMVPRRNECHEGGAEDMAAKKGTGGRSRTPESLIQRIEAEEEKSALAGDIRSLFRGQERGL